jgi:hypothetical protein
VAAEGEAEAAGAPSPGVPVAGVVVAEGVDAAGESETGVEPVGGQDAAAGLQAAGAAATGTSFMGSETWITLLTNRVVSLIVVPGWKPCLLPSVMSATILFQSIAGEVPFRVTGSTIAGATGAVVFVAGAGEGVAAATTGVLVDVGVAASPAGVPSWRL